MRVVIMPLWTDSGGGEWGYVVIAPTTSSTPSGLIVVSSFASPASTSTAGVVVAVIASDAHASRSRLSSSGGVVSFEKVRKTMSSPLRDGESDVVAADVGGCGGAVRRAGDEEDDDDRVTTLKPSSRSRRSPPKLDIPKFKGPKIQNSIPFSFPFVLLCRVAFLKGVFLLIFGFSIRGE